MNKLKMSARALASTMPNVLFRWTGLLATLIMIMPFMACAMMQDEEKVARIVVEATGQNYLNAIVSVEAPGQMQPWRPLQLVHAETGDQIPVQVEPERDGAPARLWFRVDGELTSGTQREYVLRYGEPVMADNAPRLVLDQSHALIERNGVTMFSYNHAHVIPPEGVRSAFIRSGYIHPVHSPSGLLVTEDFPGDHHHHKGVWFPWTRTVFEGRAIDFWNLGGNQGTVQFSGFESMDAGPVYAGITARHEHVDLTQPQGGKTALDELWDLRAWNTTEPWFLWDLASTQTPATDAPLKLLEYHYGGLGFRGARAWANDNHHILSSEGHTKADGHTERSRWVAHSGQVEPGKWATVVIMVHPQNQRLPEPMRIWPSGGAFFCYSPVQLGEWTLEPGRDYRFHYRFWVYDGRIDADEAERMWQQFAHPPRVHVIY